MTRMSGPLKVKQPYTDTTVASIDVSGSAKFLGGISFTGEMVATGTIKSIGRIQVGGSAGDMGDVVLCRQVALPANTTKATTTLPNGSDVVDITMNVQTAPGGSAQSTVNVLVGTTAQDTRFANFTNVSAQGLYRVASRQTSAWNSVSGASAIITVHTTAASGAIASGASGRVNIFYVKRQ